MKASGGKAVRIKKTPTKSLEAFASKILPSQHFEKAWKYE